MSDSPRKGPIPFLRLGITGAFMGLANLVPGVSGGTMVVALGLYQEFIDAMARLTRLRPTMRSLIVLAMLFGVSMVTIFAFASLIEGLMEGFLPAMLALFIGMTLGGGPTLWRDLRVGTGERAAYIAAGFVAMAVIALFLRPGSIDPNWFLFFIGGVVGSAAMVLPGISGSYLLLIMGLYLPIIAGISEFRHALSSRDMDLLFSLAFSLILPVGLGLVVGIVVLSNLLKFFLDRYHQPTTGVLLGLLIGSVLGLYPFRAPDFDKLPRHAVEVEVEGARELRILGFGWEAEAEDPVFRRLEALSAGDLTVEVLAAGGGVAPGLEDIAEARRRGAIVLAYDVEVPREVRRAAREKLASDAIGGREVRVELTIVPNTEFTAGKGGLALLLVGAGFAMTMGLAGMGRRNSAGAGKDDGESARGAPA